MHYSSTASSLIMGLRVGEPSAWTRLVDLYGPVVYRWARKAGITASDSSDIVQEVLLDVGGSFAMTVNNVAPEIVSLSHSATQPGDVGEGDPVTLTLSVADPGTDDPHTGLIHWGDGQTTELPVDPVTGAVSVGHVYETGGVYSIGVTVNQDDGASVQSMLTVLITGAGLRDSVLCIVGT